MSGTNANCHVSNKWEDTGGSDNPECVATDLLIHDPNDVSLSELIENEFASRKKLMCELEEAKNESNLLIVTEMSSSVAEPPVVVNGCPKMAATNHRTSCNVTQVDDFDVLYNQEVDATNEDELVKVVDEIVTNGHHHDVVDHAKPDPFDDICLMNGPASEESLKDGASDSTTAQSSAVFDSLENSICETTTADSSPPQPQIVQISPNLPPSCESNPSNSNPVVIDNPSTATNFDNDFVPLSEVQIVSEDSAIEAAPTVVSEAVAAVVSETVAAVVSETVAVVASEAAPAAVSEATPAVVPEAAPAVVPESVPVVVPKPVAEVEVQPEPKMLTRPLPKLEIIDYEPSVSHHNGSVVDQEWICVGDATGLHTIIENSSSMDESSEPEFVYEEYRSRNLVEESARNLIYEDVAVGEPVECSNRNVSCRIVDQQLLDPVSSPESQEMTSSCSSSVAELMENGKTQEELLKLCDDDYFGDVARRILEERSRMESGAEHSSETKLIKGCSFGLLNGCDVVSESNTNSAEKKSVKKKKSTSEESTTTTKTKKTKKTKKYEEKENISVRSGFGKFDQLTKKTVMHVRSSDPSKAQQQFSQNESSADSGSVCKACNKTVFAMEQIKAERAVWHKNCFRCKTCNKQLTVDVYSSHEGELFCKPHFRDLFKPKVVIEEEKPSSDKPDLGLEELGSLNVKSRFQVFEKQAVEESTDKSPICVKRSPSILSKLAKFQAKGMDVGVSSDIFNGIDYEESSSSDEEPVHNDNVTRNSVVKEKPVAFNKMNDVKKNWENGQTARREDRQEERRLERQNIRSRLFQGKQNKMREAYENAVAESERSNVKKDIEIRSEKARTIKEKFEKGEVLPDESDEEQEKKAAPKNEDVDVFEAGISRKSRAIFQEIDAAVKTQNNSFSSPPQAQPTQNGHRSHRESESPEKELPKDPNVVRCEEPVVNEEEVLKKSHTTAKMLSLFRQLEEAQDVVPDGLKPLKKFTPPPASSGTSSEEESEDESEEPSEASIVLDDVVRACDKPEDEYLKTAQNAAKAKALKEKFEKWEPEKQSNNNAINLLDSEQASLDTTKSLRARFESMKGEPQSDKPRPKVHRFVDNSMPGLCDTCFKKVYPLEKVEAGDKVFHRSCFKCTRCSGILRMETFTMNNGHLYCVPHFKQLFITKGNYDEGFGNDQHKAKWPVHTGVAMTNGLH